MMLGTSLDQELGANRAVGTLALMAYVLTSVLNPSQRLWTVIMDFVMDRLLECYDRSPRCMAWSEARCSAVERCDTDKVTQLD